MRKKLFRLFVIMMLLVSCTDQEEISITYKTEMSVTASHIFDGFSKVLGDEFTMKGTNNGDWDLNLHAFIYNEDGVLVKKEEARYPNLTTPLVFDLNLLPGKYSIVTIADFSGTFAGHEYKFWNISDEESLADLSITESETIINSPFETLGVSSKDFEIDNSVENISIDIKPVTGLLQTIIWDTDMTGNGINGFSSYAQYFENIEIYAPALMQTVKFDGITPRYELGAQSNRFMIHAHSPKNQFEKNGTTEVLGFRALLPIKDRDFFWEARVTKGMGELLFKDGKDFQTSDLTDKIVIESGGQYAMDLLLDGLYLFVEEYNPNEDMFKRIQKHIDSLNEKAFSQIMDRNFDQFVGKSIETVQNTFGKGFLDDNTLYYFDYNQYLKALSFTLDQESGKVISIKLLFQNINDDFRKRMIDYLTNRFTVYEKGTDTYTKAFIDGFNLDSSNVGILWFLDTDILTYVNLK